MKWPWLTHTEHTDDRPPFPAFAARLIQYLPRHMVLCANLDESQQQHWLRSLQTHSTDSQGALWETSHITLYTQYTWSYVATSEFSKTLPAGNEFKIGFKTVESYSVENFCIYWQRQQPEFNMKLAISLQPTVNERFDGKQTGWSTSFRILSSFP